MVLGEIRTRTEESSRHECPFARRLGQVSWLVSWAVGFDGGVIDLPSPEIPEWLTIED